MTVLTSFPNNNPTSTPKIPIADSDGDVGNLSDVLGAGVYDKNEANETDEQLLNVGGHGTDLRATTAIHSSYFDDPANWLVVDGGIAAIAGGVAGVVTGTAQLVQSEGANPDAGDKIIAGFYSIQGGLYALGTAYNAYQAQKDPFDPNYAQVFVPPPSSPPTVPAFSVGLPASTETILQQNFQYYANAAADVATLSYAVYITQNRLFSAYNSNDIASFELQNNTINNYIAQLAAAETRLSQADTVVAGDFTTLGIDSTITPTDFANLQAQLKAQGFAALSPQQQAIIKTYLPTAADQQTLLAEMVSADPTAAPTSLVANLRSQATQMASMAKTITIPPITNTSVPPLNLPSVPVGTFHGSHDQYVIINDNGPAYVQDTLSGRDGTQTIPATTLLTFTDGTGVIDPTGTAEDIARLYAATLGRGPDVAGLEYWTQQVDGTHVPISAIANTFATSPEFMHDYGSLSDTAFVNQLYQNVLGRPADTAGAQYWVGVLASGAGRGNVALSFAESQENDAKTIATAGEKYNAEAYRLYQAALDRAPDPPGLAYWSSVLAAGARPQDVAQDFISSPEFQQKYGGLSPSDFVTTLYQNVLHRAPDASGQQYWTSQLQNGVSESSVLFSFADSIENRQATATATHDGWVFISA